MARLFGTDGVRGIANKDLTPELAYRIGRAGAYILGKNTSKNKIIIGKDTRKSGDMLEGALIAGICSIGIDVVSLGVVPTPTVSYLIKEYDALAGIVISASHNPSEYNGIKFFDKDGFKLQDKVEEEIEDLIFSDLDLARPIKEKIGIVIDGKNGYKVYLDHLKKSVNLDFSKVKVALDCGHGALYKIGPELFVNLGADIEVINIDPNGVNINDKCGSTNPKMIQALVLESKAHIGLSFDGDGDRIIAVDEKGQIINGDHILAIIATYLKKHGKLNNNTLVGTSMTNMGLDKYLETIGADIVKTDVGDKYVIEEMLKNNYVLGGEQSGHIILRDFNTTGDGLLTGIQLINIMIELNEKMSNLNKLVEDYPQVLVNARVKNELKNKYLQDDIIRKEIKNIETYFNREGRVVIRPSGTEPLVRVMIEGKNREEIERVAKNLAKTIEERMGGA